MATRRHLPAAASKAAPGAGQPTGEEPAAGRARGAHKGADGPRGGGRAARLCQCGALLQPLPMWGMLGTETAVIMSQHAQKRVRIC